MQAPNGLAVLIDEKRVNDLLEQRSGAWALFRQGLNVFLFLLFLALYTLLAVGEPYGQQRAFQGYVRRLFDEGAAMPLRQVESASTFWQYTRESILPAIYGQNTEKYYYPGAIVDTFLPMQGGNRLYGVVRIRMLKVRKDTGCSVPDTFLGEFRSCYGPYSTAAEDQEVFGPVADDGIRDFRFYNLNGGLTFAGDLATYSRGGFMKALTSNYDESLKTVDFMQQNSFVTVATRAIFYEFTVYNFNLGLYAYCRIAFEVSPSGLWSKSFTVEVLTQRHLGVLGFGSTLEWLLLVGEAVLVLFVLRYFTEELSEICGSSQRINYLKDAWNILDWVNLILICVAVGFRIDTWVKAGSLKAVVGDPKDQGIGTFTDFSEVAENVRIMRGLTAFNTVLTWFKTVKYYNIVPYIAIFMETVTRSQRMLNSFIVIFLATFFGFVVSFSVALGENLSTFRTSGKAFIFLMRTFLGDGDMGIVIATNPNTGTLLMGLFVLGMIFIMMNLFAGIMIRALAEAKRKQDMQQARKWEQIIDRTKTFKDVLWRSLTLELKFRSLMPGLYARMLRRKKKRDEQEMKRDMFVLQKHAARQPDDLMALGPGSPTCGRRQKKTLASVAIRDNDSDDGSEADLGPLFSPEQLKARPNSQASTSEGASGDSSSGSFTASSSELDEGQQAIELVIKSVAYVSSGIVERSRGARGVLFNEMADSKEVLMGVGAVLEVLGKRARDLEAQQTQLLKHF